MKRNQPIWTILAILAASHSSIATASQLSLEQAPPGTATEPVPNIIVSVDDSGSMGTVGIATLKSALTQTFSSTNVADGRIRLAWQSMNRCRGLPSSDPACNSNNGMKPLQGTHRTTFLSWVNGLSAGGGTPSHAMFAEAGDYLSKTNLGVNSPWALDPGVTESPVQSCRKSFQIFMTDGNWNSAAAYTNQHIDTANYNNVRTVRGGGNADGTSKTLPDNLAYSTTAAATRLYRDAWGDSTSTTRLSTLSDLAFHYWSTDLQPGLTNNVSFRQKVTAPESVGTVSVQPYWNPRNNPASWQHMVTYTIGFDADGPGGNAGASEWAGAPVWGGSTFAGDYPGLTSGTVAWPTPFCGATVTNPGNLACDGATGYSERGDARKAELWHSALNARGLFVPAPNAQALVDAFKLILGEILADSSSPLVTIASSSSRLRANGYAYVAGFDSAKDWSGDLSAFKITVPGNTISKTSTWTASSYLDNGSFNTTNRKILSHNGIDAIAFNWASISPTQQALLTGSDSTTIAQDRALYLRGDRSKEIKNGGSFRNRTSRLGDIVNSNIWNMGLPSPLAIDYKAHDLFRAKIRALNSGSGRTKTLFVGANDGMLHGFDAANGNEILAYIPKGVYSKLRNYTSPSYGHEFFVDGQPFTGDADLKYPSTATTTKDDWKTLLVSGLGWGGRGYFVLDVTDPSATTASSVLMDNTFPSNGTDTFTGYQDVGHIYANPVVDTVSGTRTEQIVKLNNGRWAVLLGNGVNSINERPALLIQYLDGTKSLKILLADAITSSGNGLANPRAIDVNGDGAIDIAYAGDLAGNLWKFDLTSTNDTDWGIYNLTGSTTSCKPTANPLKTCTPLYIAKDSSGNRQPITVTPTWMAHPTLGGVQLAFGTGKLFTTVDRSNTATQTIYSVLDSSKYTTTTTSVTPIPTGSTNGNITFPQSRTKLKSQSVVSRVGSTDYYNTSQNEVDYAAGQRGWYFDLPASTERTLNDAEIFEGQKVTFITTLPKQGTTGESCDFTQGASENWVNVLNMITGKPSAKPAWPAADGTRDLATRTKFGEGEFIKVVGDPDTTLISIDNNPAVCTTEPCTADQCKAGETCFKKLTLTGANAIGARTDWRDVR